MITQALTYIANKINVAFFNINGSPRVILGNVAALYDPDYNEPNILLSLINIEEEPLLRNPENFFKRNNSVVYKNPPMYFNVTIMFGAFHTDPNREQAYTDSLTYIQKVIGFFQRESVFDPSNSPDLPQGIEKLVFELVNLNLEQLHHLWTLLGGKYIPSVVYKMRMVIIDEALEEMEAPLITQVVIDDNLKFQE
jgi:hypothetical protein